jgi:hypothetical protein
MRYSQWHISGIQRFKFSPQEAHIGFNYIAPEKRSHQDVLLPFQPVSVNFFAENAAEQCLGMSMLRIGRDWPGLSPHLFLKHSWMR